MTSSPVMQLSNVSKTYGTGNVAVHAMRDVTISVRPGEFIAIMGPSGSGKSTCMNIMGFLDAPFRGSYRFSDVEVGAVDRDGLAMLRRHYISFIFQSFNLLPRTSAIENVELPLIYKGVRRRERRRRAIDALTLVGLGNRLHNSPAQLSGGEQQRVAIARAIVSDPMVLLADEPTGSLDTSRSAELMTFIADLNKSRGLTIVMVTHEPAIARFARRVLQFVDGRITADGPAAEVLS